MVRPSPRLVVALLWLAIALLPLRAMGMAWMQVGAGSPTVVTAPAGAMPCHGAAPADDAVAHHACQLCDLCHAGVAVGPEAPSLALVPATAMPTAACAAPPGRVAPDGLFRPPR